MPPEPNKPAPASATSPAPVTPATPRSAFVGGGESISGGESALASVADRVALPPVRSTGPVTRIDKDNRQEEVRVRMDEGETVVPEETAESPEAVKPEAAVKPKTEAEEPFTFDKFKAALEDKEPEMPEHPTKKAERLKKEAEIASAELLKTKTEEVAPVIAKPGARDYASLGLTPEEIPHAKKMSNEAFTLFQRTKQAAVEAEKKSIELQKKLESSANYVPESYYENPKAFTLTPEYESTMQVIELADAVAKHWEAQLISIEEGGDWRDLSWNPDAKAYEMGVPQKGTAQAKVHLQRQLNSITQQQTGLNNKIRGMQQSFVNRHQQIIGAIKKEELQYFPHLEDPNHPDQVIVKDVLNKLGSIGQDKNPLAGLVAKMAAANLRLVADITELKKASAVSQARVGESVKAGPTTASLEGAGGSAKPSEKAFSVKDLQEMGLMENINLRA